MLEEGGRHSCVKSKAAIPRIMGNASGRGGEKLHECRRRRGWRGHRERKKRRHKRDCVSPIKYRGKEETEL